MEKTEMRDLLGLEVIFKGSPCFVARADRERGITVKTVDGESDKWCINRAQFLERHESFGRNDGIRWWHQFFSVAVREILEGKLTITSFDHKELCIGYDEIITSGRVMHCSFR